MARSREFNAEAVLDVATRTFWQSGYEGTSLSQLVKRTGVAPKGLYAAFGNKEALFGKCVDHYVAVHLAFFDEALTAPTQTEIVRLILDGYVRLLTSFSEHPGCMALNGVLAGDEQSEPIRMNLAARRSELEARLAARLEALPDAAGPASSLNTARLVMTFVQGLAVQAKSGLPSDEVRALASLFCKAVSTAEEGS